MTQTDGTTPRYRIEQREMPAPLGDGIWTQYFVWFIEADGTERRGPRGSTLTQLRSFMTKHYGAVEVQS